MTRRIRLIAAMALARVSDEAHHLSEWSHAVAHRLARAAMPGATYVSVEERFIFYSTHPKYHWENEEVSDVGITRALAETEER